MKIKEALKQYHEANRFGNTPGGYEDRWVRAVVGKLVFWFPNFNARREAAKRHDINHILTGYRPIELKGEMEIAFYELGAGCGTFWAAWYFNSLATILALRWPQAAWRAFQRGL